MIQKQSRSRCARGGVVGVHAEPICDDDETSRAISAMLRPQVLRCSLLPGAVVAIAVISLVAQCFAPRNAVEAQTQRENDAPGSVQGFSVSKIVQDHSGSGSVTIRITPDGIYATNATLKRVLALAFSIQAERILHEPKWVDSDTYDIEAKLDATDIEQVASMNSAERTRLFRRMLLALLKERCDLRYEYKQAKVHAYALVVARGGPKLHERRPPSSDPPAAGQEDMNGHSIGAPRALYHITVTEEPMSTLATALTQRLNILVLDRTGLSGKYSWHLDWSTDDTLRDTGGGISSPTEPNGLSGPTLETALKEELGLTLRSGKYPLRVVEISSIVRPHDD